MLTRFHPYSVSSGFLPARYARLQPEIQRLHFDDNGVTGPDWGLSEMVFSKSSGRTLAARR